MKASIPKAVLAAVLLAVVFSVVYILSVFVIGLLLQVGFIKAIVSIITRSKFYEEILISLALYLATISMMATAEATVNEKQTRKLAVKIVGWAILISSVAFLVLNIMAGNAFLINILFIICGFAITRV